jgi:hypothetical protein
MSDLLVFYLPHLYASVAAFQVVNRGLRRIFWSDVYESSHRRPDRHHALDVPVQRDDACVSRSRRRVRSATRNASRKRWRSGGRSSLLTVALIAGVVRGPFAIATASWRSQ